MSEINETKEVEQLEVENSNETVQDHQQEKIEESQENQESTINLSQDTQSESSESIEEDDIGLVQSTIQNEEQLKEALKHILNENVEVEDFVDMVDNCSLQELTILMDELSLIPVSRDNIRKVGKLKKRFDSHYPTVLKEIQQTVAEENDKSVIDEEKIRNIREQANSAHKAFFAALSRFNEKKAEFEVEDQKNKEENSKKKRALVERLKEIVLNEEVTAIDEVLKLKESWRDVGQVLQQDMEDLFHTYRTYLDQFFILRKQYNQLIEQDRKINLQKKLKLIEELEKLIPVNFDELPKNFWKTSNEQVVALHNTWKEIGAVPRANSDEIWSKFKEITDQFYSLKREFFSSLDEKREKSKELKVELLEKVKPYRDVQYDTLEEWNQATEELKAIHLEWRNIGPAPIDINKTLNEECKEIFDIFFSNRNQYYDALDHQKDDILEKKQELLDKAEECKDSDDWAATTDILIKLQKDWNNIGPDNFKDARKLRKTFRKACDHFFKRKKQHLNNLREAEKENLIEKENICSKIEQLVNEFENQDSENYSVVLNIDELSLLKQQFDDLGRVPLKSKDEINNRFQKAYTKFIEKAIDDPIERERYVLQHKNLYKRISSNPKLNISSIEKEEKKYIKRIRSLEEKILQFENNFLFISQSKSSEVLRKDIEEKIQKSIDLKKSFQQKLKALRELKSKDKNKKHQEGNTQAEEQATNETNPSQE